MGNIFLLSQSTVYIVSALISLCVWIPMALNLYHFCGHCLLFSKGVYVEEDGRFDPNWSSPAYCGFTLIVGISIFIITCFIAIRKIILIFRGIDSTFLSVFMDALVSFFFTIMVIIDAYIVTKGFSVWCQSVIQRFDSCETASEVMIIGKNPEIDPKGFFIQLGTVQFGIWSLLVCGVLSLVIALRKLFLLHEMENMIVSMARERQRHIVGDYSTLRD